MRITHRLWMLALALLMLFAACSPRPPTTPARTSTPPTQPPTATATAVPTPEPMALGVPALQYGTDDSRLVLASSLTGKPIDGTTSIPLSNSNSYAFSPDGRTLAVASLPRLYLISLPSWQSRTVELDLHGGLRELTYNADGSLLALASADADSALRIVDAQAGDILASAQAGFAVHNLKFTVDGKGLMAYGPQLADKGQEGNLGVSIGAPEAALLSVSDLHPLWSVKLSALRDGVFPKPGAKDLYQPGAASIYSPAVVFAPAADVLYLVHGDADRLTTVDFTKHTAKTVSLHIKTSWLEQWLGLDASVAYAKGLDGTTKQAVVSPDGRLLYVVGSTSTVTPIKGSSDWNFTFTSIGLQVVDTRDGTLAQQLDTQADMAVLAPDKEHLLLLGWMQDSSRPWTEIYDLRSMKLTQRLDDIRLLPARRLDGNVVLLSSVMITGTKCTMASVDPATWKTIATWTGFPCSDWLMDP